MSLAPWKYVADFLLGAGLTAVIVVVELLQLQRAATTAALERAAAVGSGIGRTVDSYAIPTIAGETFVASGITKASADDPSGLAYVREGFWLLGMA